MSDSANAEKVNRDTLVADALREIAECHTGDVEMDHVNADEALCKLLYGLGLGEVAEAWDAVEKWYA